MNVFGNSSKQLMQALTANAENETMDYVLQEMQAVLGEEMPEADAVRTYLQDPDKPWTSCWSVRKSISARSAT